MPRTLHGNGSGHLKFTLPLKALSKPSSLCLICFLTTSTHRSFSLHCLRHTFSLPGFVLEENTLLSGLGIEDGGGYGAAIGGIIHVVEAGVTPHGVGAIPQGAGGPNNHLYTQFCSTILQQMLSYWWQFLPCQLSPLFVCLCPLSFPSELFCSIPQLSFVCNGGGP